ncbi:MAG: hypothetical protein IBX55_00205 [Methyloprofundus sp.]|nr:hypothetical protein [Methyloprofundus sp.]
MILNIEKNFLNSTEISNMFDIRKKYITQEGYNELISVAKQTKEATFFASSITLLMLVAILIIPLIKQATAYQYLEVNTINLTFIATLAVFFVASIAFYKMHRMTCEDIKKSQLYRSQIEPVSEDQMAEMNIWSLEFPEIKNYLLQIGRYPLVIDYDSIESWVFDKNPVLR